MIHSLVIVIKRQVKSNKAHNPRGIAFRGIVLGYPVGLDGMRWTSGSISKIRDPYADKHTGKKTLGEFRTHHPYFWFI